MCTSTAFCSLHIGQQLVHKKNAKVCAHAMAVVCLFALQQLSRLISSNQTLAKAFLHMADVSRRAHMSSHLHHCCHNTQFMHSFPINLVCPSNRLESPFEWFSGMSLLCQIASPKGSGFDSTFLHLHCHSSVCMLQCLGNWSTSEHGKFM